MLQAAEMTIPSAGQTQDAVSGLIIAGGRAQRMEGRDKGLQPYLGRPLLAHVIERFAPQVQGQRLNVNHHREAYAGFGLPCVADTVPGYAGPLAGLLAGLETCITPLLACVPCDAPLLPMDLVQRLRAALQEEPAGAAAAAGTAIAVASAAGRLQPTFMLCRRSVQPELARFLASGERRVGRWLDDLALPFRVVRVDFPDTLPFTNINTLEELNTLEKT